MGRNGLTMVRTSSRTLQKNWSQNMEADLENVN